MCCSPARVLPQQSSSSGDLPPEMMESETPPQASSPPRADDLEVSSWRVSLDRQEVRGMIKTAPEGNTSAVKGTGGTTPVGTGKGGPELSGLQPNTAPETDSESSKRPPSGEMGVPTPTGHDDLHEPGGAGHSYGRTAKCICLRGASYLNGYSS